MYEKYMEYETIGGEAILTLGKTISLPRKKSI
jgi:hypothetical protein